MHQRSKKVLRVSNRHDMIKELSKVIKAGSRLKKIASSTMEN